MYILQVIYPSGHWILKSLNSNATNMSFILLNKLYLMFSTKWEVSKNKYVRFKWLQKLVIKSHYFIV